MSGFVDKIWITSSRTGRHFFNLNSKPVCHTLSKACNTFKNTPGQKFLFQTMKLFLSTIRWTGGLRTSESKLGI